MTNAAATETAQAANRSGSYAVQNAQPDVYC